MSDEQNTPLSPEEQALLDDLKQYDNPEVFEDSSLPQIYKFRVITKARPDLPAILRMEIDGDALPDILLEATLRLMRLDSRVEKEGLETIYGAPTWEEVRAKMLSDKEYLEGELEMRRFFLRNFPKLLVTIYNIAMDMSLFYPIKQVLDEPTERRQYESYLKKGLSKALHNLERDIKRMLKTRSKGRPAKYEYAGDGAPELARKVWTIAREKMGEARGIEAVPGLKEIAIELGMSEGALGKQLTRVKWTWTRIKNDLANLP